MATVESICGSSMMCLWIFAAALSLAAASEQFFVAHAPDYVKFLPEGKDIPLSEVPDVISSILGYSTDKDLQFDGLAETTLFRRPKASVLISIDGMDGDIPDLDIKHLAKYKANVDDPELNTESVVSHLQQSPTTQQLIVDFTLDHTMFDVKSRHPTLFRGLPTTFNKVKHAIQHGEPVFSAADLGALNISQEADLLFLGELQSIHQVLEALRQKPDLIQDNSPDFFHFRLRGFKELVKKYTGNSLQIRDALSLLKSFLNKVTDEFRDLHNKNVVIEVVTLPGTAAVNVRKGRSLLEANPTSSPEPLSKKLNVAPSYGDDYAAIFNIILWTMVGLAVAVITISVGIWNMDPGRDSIIYRMTSQRMKKD